MADQNQPAPQAEAPAPVTTSSFSFADMLQREETEALQAVKEAGLSIDGDTPAADAAAETADTMPAETIPPAETVQGADSLPDEAQPPRPPESVPYGRFAEVYKSEREARAAVQQMQQRMAFLEGQMSAARQQPQPQQPQRPQVDPIAVIDHRIADLDAKYEKSEIQWADYRRQQQQLADHRTGLLVARAVDQQAKSQPQQQAPQPAPMPSPRTSVALQRATAELKAAEPWVSDVPKDILEAPSIQARVNELARAAGKDVDPRTEAGWLSRAVFTILAAKEQGLDRAYGKQVAAPQPQGNGQSQPAPTLPAQVKQPPPIGTMGVGAPAPIPGGYTAEQISRMPMEDMMKLPREVLDHFAPERTA